ncbi:MAG: Tm-1-like ATP-binding domain-containing protein [Deltaproteobacteria bacterium]|nr:Tm-1-like ATP-binding domain-containing protein [Deltaproteobacteria bacterium]
MNRNAVIAILGTFDSKGEEHLFIRSCIERRGFQTLTINVGIKSPSPFPSNLDLYQEVIKDGKENLDSRDKAIQAVLLRAKELVRKLHEKGEICGIISAGGGTGTHLGTSVMHSLPLGVPKVMVSTVASRDMANIVGTKDITMMHSVVDLLGINSISGNILDRAAGAICGMAEGKWRHQSGKRRIALTLFGFITQAAEGIKQSLEGMGYEVIPFHANGTGGMAMEELAAEACFHGILDLATHELADALMNGYCGGIGPERLEPVPGLDIPRLVVPGGLDCAVLEFNRHNVPDKFRDRKIFFYDFRSAIRLNDEETQYLAGQLAKKLNHKTSNIKVLIPILGWSEADREGGPLYDPMISEAFIRRLKGDLDPLIEVREVDLHINDPSFATVASNLMDEML